MSKKKYKVTVTEVLEFTKTVIAESREEAKAQVKKEYDDLDIVLDYSDLTEVKIKACRIR